jgi:AcrR family transcriptional regulator
MVDLVAEHGYQGVRVRGLTRLAGVSTRSFYKHFANVEECFLFTYESLLDAALRRARDSQREVDDWEEGLRSALRSVLEDVAGNPRQARLVLVEAYALGLGMRRQMSSARDGFERLLTKPLARTPHEALAPEQVGKAIVGGLTRVARVRILDRGHPDLTQIERDLGDWMLGLYSERRLALEPFNPPARVANSDPSKAAEVPCAADFAGSLGDDRGRILAATARLALAGGYSSLTTAGIRAEAGVSRRRFHAHFIGVEDCFLEMVEGLSASAAAQADEQGNGAGRRSRLEVAIGALCAEIARNPAAAQLIFSEIFAPGRGGLQCQDRLVSRAAHRLRESRLGGQSGEVAAEASIAAAWRLTQAEVEAGRARSLSRLVPLLTLISLAPAAT